ncbi:MAG: hypothetical protein ACRDRI_25145 [Pseudonocardiaceae bacterium]
MTAERAHPGRPPDSSAVALPAVTGLRDGGPELASADRLGATVASDTTARRLKQGLLDHSLMQAAIAEATATTIAFALVRHVDGIIVEICEAVCRLRLWPEVDPTIKRWQQADKNRNFVDRPSIGVGIFRVRPAGHALPCKNGYARKPLDAIKLAPEFEMKTWRHLSGMRFRKMSNKMSPVATETSAGIAEMKNSVAEGLLSVVQVARCATVAFFFALLATLISVFLHDTPRSVAQWVATLGFFLRGQRSAQVSIRRRRNGFPVAILNLVFTVVNMP